MGGKERERERERERLRLRVCMKEVREGQRGNKGKVRTLTQTGWSFIPGL
jgi:hypothetical protein